MSSTIYHILTWPWLRGFQDKLPNLVLFPLYPSLFRKLKYKGNLKKAMTIFTRKSRSRVSILIYRTCMANCDLKYRERLKHFEH